jgi:hypothetical protein
MYGVSRCLNRFAALAVLVTAPCALSGQGTSYSKKTIQVKLVDLQIDIPSAWQPLPEDEMQLLKTNFAQIYREYFHKDRDKTPSFGLDIAGYRTATRGIFLAIGASFTDLHADQLGPLMKDLGREAHAKAAWGIEHGFVRQASDVSPIDGGGMEGFEIVLENTDGSRTYSAQMRLKGANSSPAMSHLLQLQFTPERGNETAAQVFRQVRQSVRYWGMVDSQRPLFDGILYAISLPFAELTVLLLLFLATAKAVLIRVRAGRTGGAAEMGPSYAGDDEGALAAATRGLGELWLKYQLIHLAFAVSAIPVSVLLFLVGPVVTDATYTTEFGNAGVPLLFVSMLIAYPLFLLSTIETVNILKSDNRRPPGAYKNRTKSRAEVLQGCAR